MNFSVRKVVHTSLPRWTVLILSVIGLTACGYAPDASVAPVTRKAQNTAKSAADTPSCEELAFQDFSALQDAAPQILSAALVPATRAESAAAFCHVTGYIAPQIEFELRLPIETWNGRYLQIGCGGYCGSTDIESKLNMEGHLAECIPSNIDEFAIGSSNSGHTGGGGGDAAWAQNAPQLQVDWGYRSEHMLRMASAAILEAYYGESSDQTFFAGCSTGGRQALMLAQRYPGDFDGILAGSPVNQLSGIMLAMAWSAQANIADDGSPILLPEQLPMIHKAAIAACDERDGVADGLIEDPRACQFDPATIQCTAAQTETQPACLTPQQVEVVRKIYSGPVDEDGNRLYPGGLSVGSELEWQVALFGWGPGGPGLNELLVRNYLRYLATWDEPLGYDELRFDAAMFEELSRLGPVYDATDPDLREFHAQGGKLILWHGWNDANASPLGTIAYYQAIQDVMGGLAATQQFAHLYMVPGMGHCGGGAGLTKFDLLTPLVDWVEQDEAPQGIVARQLESPAPQQGGQEQGGQEQAGPNQDQEAERTVIRTRPLYAYPLVARYDGSGSMDDAANFMAAEPASQHDDDIEWLGDYRSNYQQWCIWQGAELACTMNRLER